MIPEYELSVHARIPIKHKEQIEKLIQEGKFKNTSQVIRQALLQFFKNMEAEKS
jgi:Arc/MetJ-type ribon-helix-helix transcriptional regulator